MVNLIPSFDIAASIPYTFKPVFEAALKSKVADTVRPVFQTHLIPFLRSSYALAGRCLPIVVGVMFTAVALTAIFSFVEWIRPTTAQARERKRSADSAHCMVSSTQRMASSPKNGCFCWSENKVPKDLVQTWENGILTFKHESEPFIVKWSLNKKDMTEIESSATDQGRAASLDLSEIENDQTVYISFFLQTTWSEMSHLKCSR